VKDLRAVLLMEAQSAERVRLLARKVGVFLRGPTVSDLAALTHAFDDAPELLFSFGTSVIAPAGLLARPGLLALNVHAASPDYPGRDPHHFAVYDGALRYGATMHQMTSKVDSGQILDVELFDVPAGVTPVRMLELANQSAWVLIERFFDKLAQGRTLYPMEGVCWGDRKTTRKMFLDLCRVDGTMTEDEFNRRLRATSMPGFYNLYTEMHGYRFRMESKI
jgi:methionyl-tRNA formyltransferase